MGSPVTTRSRFPRPSQHLNHLVLELVVFVVVSAVVPDSVQALVAGVLVPVLARPASPVVQVPNETAVVLEPVLIAVSAAATVDCGGGGCFCEEICGGGCCCVKSCCLGTPCLERSSGSSPQILINISRISRSAADAIRSCSFAHLIAVARCDTQTFPRSIPMTRAGSSH